MKRIPLLAATALLILRAALPLAAQNERQDIRLRIHTPFPDLYEGESDIWLVRVENHGEETVPVPDGSGTDEEEFPPPQFRVQTSDDAEAGKAPESSPWDDIVRFGSGGNEVERSMMEPGQAMESPSRWLPGKLRTPPQGGKFRLAMQVGPDDFVYSNWITRKRHAGPAPDMKTIQTEDPWHAGLVTELQISEGTKPRYLWFFTKGPASTLLIRICEVPDGMLPSIQLDRERAQLIITFPPGGPQPVYHGHRCALTKSTPWPVGYLSKDFSLTPYPISTPSPIEFPMALFAENVGSEDSHETENLRLEQKPESRPTGETSESEKISRGGFPAWTLAAVSALLLGTVVFIVRRMRGAAGRKSRRS